MYREKKKKKRLEETYPNTNKFTEGHGTSWWFFSFSIFQNFSNVIYITFIQITNKNMSD